MGSPDMETEDVAGDAAQEQKVDIGELHNERERLRKKYGDNHPLSLVATAELEKARAKRDETKPLALHVKDAEKQQKKADDMLQKLGDDTKKQKEILDAASQQLEDNQKSRVFWEEANEQAASKLLALRMQQAAAKDGAPAGEAPNPEQAASATLQARLAQHEQATGLLQQLEGLVEARKKEEQEAAQRCRQRHEEQRQHEPAVPTAGPAEPAPVSGPGATSTEAATKEQLDAMDEEEWNRFCATMEDVGEEERKRFRAAFDAGRSKRQRV